MTLKPGNTEMKQTVFTVPRYRNDVNRNKIIKLLFKKKAIIVVLSR